MKYRYVVLVILSALILTSCTREEESVIVYPVDPPVEEVVPIDPNPVTTLPEVEEEVEEIPIVEIDIYEYVSEEEIVMLAKTGYGEARGVGSTMEQAAVYWCILNRWVIEGISKYSLADIITSPNQFVGYSKKHPVEDHLYELAKDVVERWIREQNGEVDVGRVLPPDYKYFKADGKGHNEFRNKYRDYDASNIWDWSYPNPYEN